jgi:hypothetical protein
MGGNERSRGIRLHFLVPSGFVSSPSSVLVTVTTQRSVVFVMEGELAVIEEGLLAWSC